MKRHRRTKAHWFEGLVEEIRGGESLRQGRRRLLVWLGMLSWRVDAQDVGRRQMQHVHGLWVMNQRRVGVVLVVEALGCAVLYCTVLHCTALHCR